MYIPQFLAQLVAQTVPLLVLQHVFDHYAPRHTDQIPIVYSVVYGMYSVCVYSLYIMRCI